MNKQSVLRFVDPNPLVFTGRAGRTLRCNVRPRYSAGSPAQVDDHTALGVADDEKKDYEHAMEGAYGEEAKLRAEALGLRGIVYAMAESGSGKNFRWLIQDLITGECFRRHHDNEIHRLGYTAFMHLPQSVQARLKAKGCTDNDYDRTFWKLERDWVKYEPELIRL